MLRYYVYVSRTKVDMLHAQIPHEAPKKVKTEFRAGPSFAGGTRTTEAETEVNLYTRLEEVVAYLTQFGDVGSITSGSDWIEGITEMAWIASKRLFYLTTGIPSESESTILGLSGSHEHVLGSGPTTYERRYASLLTGMHIELSRFWDDLSPGEAKGMLGNPAYIAGRIAASVGRMRTPLQRFAFLAKALGSWERNGNLLVLATPLYVALADRPPPE